MSRKHFTLILRVSHECWKLNWHRKKKEVEVGTMMVVFIDSNYKSEYESMAGDEQKMVDRLLSGGYNPF